MIRPRCPRCLSKKVAPAAVWMEASDERILSTHICEECHEPFRHTPGTWSSTRPEVEAVYTEG